MVAASRPAAGGAAVPGQRGKATGSVRPPVASAIPVFRPPMPASPAPRLVTGETYGSPRRSAEERTYGRPVAEQTGRRRADETAIDIGYTGRRSKPDHAADESAFAGWADDAGWGRGGWRDDGAGWAGADPAPGYPGWTEADERQGRNRSAGW